MSELDEIAGRLEAVEQIDWSEIEHFHEEEFYGDWIRIGPIMIQTTDSPDLADQADRAESEAVAEFVQHAVADMRLLLDRLRERL